MLQTKNECGNTSNVCLQFEWCAMCSAGKARSETNKAEKLNRAQSDEREQEIYNQKHDVL